jgi:hypothetical protein
VLKQCPTRTVACHHSDTTDTDTWPIRDVSGDLVCHPLMGPCVISSFPRVIHLTHILTISGWSTRDPPVLAPTFNTPSRVRVDPSESGNSELRGFGVQYFR